LGTAFLETKGAKNPFFWGGDEQHKRKMIRAWGLGRL